MPYIKMTTIEQHFLNGPDKEPTFKETREYFAGTLNEVLDKFKDQITSALMKRYADVIVRMTRTDDAFFLGGTIYRTDVWFEYKPGDLPPPFPG